ncbi:MAG: hypothetical protein HYT47_00170 [Candidatus Vogelbacteria bacterium]|nr:hypothetical protein [Candidatus Vogelbacteria bacterium]
MKIRHALFLWLMNVLVLAGGLGLVYLIRRDAEVFISARADQYFTARAKADLTNWQQGLAANEPNLVKVRSAFISRESLIQFIEGLETVARESGVDLTLGEPVIESNSLTLSMKAVGSFAKVYRWLERLENLPYRLTFERINLSAGTDWSGDISLVLHSFLADYVQN